jgi:hypothetical protein
MTRAIVSAGSRWTVGVATARGLQRRTENPRGDGPEDGSGSGSGETPRVCSRAMRARNWALRMSRSQPGRWQTNPGTERTTMCQGCWRKVATLVSVAAREGGLESPSKPEGLWRKRDARTT